MFLKFLAKLYNSLKVPNYEQYEKWIEGRDWHRNVQKNILKKPLLEPDEANTTNLEEEIDPIDDSIDLKKHRDIDHYLEHSKAMFDDALENFRNLDTKAEKLLTFAASMSAAIFVIIRGLNTQLSICLGISYALFLVAIFLTIWLRRPVAIESPKSVKDFLDRTVEFSDLDIKLKMISSYYTSTVSHKFLSSWKANLLGYAHYALGFGLLLLFLGLLFEAAQKPEKAKVSKVNLSGEIKVSQ